MDPRFLFFTGEPATTLPLLKQRPTWSPVLSAITFNVTADRLHRGKSAGDDFRGAVYFADVRDKDIERHNLRVLSEHTIPCWPDPATLLAVSDRHAALGRCVAAGLVDHRVVQSHFTEEPLLPFPYVLKIGEEHRGREALDPVRERHPSVGGIATMEPFFVGASVRVLLLGDRAFGVRIHNEGSWIKNSPGASFEAWSPGRRSWRMRAGRCGSSGWRSLESTTWSIRRAFTSSSSIRSRASGSRRRAPPSRGDLR